MFCTKCKYDLRGSIQERRCPECGWPFNPERPRTYRPSPDELPRSSPHDVPSPVWGFIMLGAGFLAATCVGFFVANVLRAMGTTTQPAPGAGRTIFNPRAPSYVLTVCAVLSGLTVLVVAFGIWRKRFNEFVLGILAGLLAAVVYVMVDLLAHL